MLLTSFYPDLMVFFRFVLMSQSRADSRGK